MRAVMNIIRAILALIWGLLLAGNILLYMDETAGGNSPPSIYGYACYTVPDDSMRPDLIAGDLAIIRLGQKAKPGDAVLCGGSLTRIIGTSEGQLILKPDNADGSALAGPDEPEGVLLTFIPGLGPAAEFMRSLPGLVTIGGVGLGLIVLSVLLTRPVKERPQRDPAGVERLEPVKPTKSPKPPRRVKEPSRPAAQEPPRQTRRERKEEERAASAQLDRMGQVGRKSRSSGYRKPGYKPRH